MIPFLTKRKDIIFSTLNSQIELLKEKMHKSKTMTTSMFSKSNFRNKKNPGIYQAIEKKNSQLEYRRAVVYSTVLHPTFLSSTARMSH